MRSAHLVRTGLVLATVAALGVLFATPSPTRADPYTFTVEYTTDGPDTGLDGICDGMVAAGDQCTLRAAIQEANAHAGLDVIEFEIAGAGPHTIAVGSPLPWITSPVTIDGFTQSGASANTDPLSAGSNAVMQIVVDGSATSNTDGIALSGGAAGTTIRGLVVNNFDEYGVTIYGAAGSGNTVAGNYIGTNAAGTVAAGNGAYGVNVTSAANTIGGPSPGDRNVISASTGPGVYVAGTGGNTVQGNYIGTNAAGTAALPNTASGVTIVNSPGNTVAGNVISGNSGGVRIDQAASTGNVVTDNIIGLAVDGDTPLGNGGGVSITGAAGNQIGEPGHGNVISANTSDGVRITGATADQNIIQGNLIGTNADGDAGRGNGAEGITVYDAEKTQIGGPDPGEGNVISGNDGWGIFLDGGVGSPATITTIQGNRIGTDITGMEDLGNNGPGIALDAGTHSTKVGGEIGVTPGGPCTGACNVISGNAWHGIWMLESKDAVVQNNAIGAAADGSSPLGNSLYGVLAESAIDNEIEGNTVAHNGSAGVYVDVDSRGNKITGGSIFANGGLGIDLAPDGVAANDPGDGDGGANFGQNYPVLTSAVAGSSLTVEGSIDTTPSEYVTIQFYSSAECDSPSGHGEGETALGGFSALVDGSGVMDFSREISSSVPAGNFLTATATDDFWNTSEFSECIEIEAAPTPTPTATPPPTPEESVTPTPAATATPTATPSATPTGSPGEGRLGDTDCDDDADSVDALMVLRDAAALPHSAACIAVGDVDCDDDRDSVDALRILRHVAALSNPVPPGCRVIGT